MNYIIILAALFLSLNCKAQQLAKNKIKTIIASDLYPNIDGVIISQNDSILFEEYFNSFERDSLHDTRSSFKSITSLLTGIAIDQGLFSLDDQIGRYITEWGNDQRGKIIIKDLLEMKSGLDCECFF
jgi:hypothetical protein